MVSLIPLSYSPIFRRFLSVFSTTPIPIDSRLGAPSSSFSAHPVRSRSAVPLFLVPPLPAVPRAAQGSGPLVGILGEVTVSGAEWPLTTQQLSLLALLASVGESGRDAVIEALWAGRPVSDGRFANLISETRAKVGRHHLPESSGGRYRVDGVGTDLAVFRSLVGGAVDAVDPLITALALVRGVPFAGCGGRYWSWPYAAAGLLASAEIIVTETACRLANRALGIGDLGLARWACEQGLRAAPLDETLTGLLTGIYLDLGMPATAQRVVNEWELRVEQLGCGHPSPLLRTRL